MSEPAPISASSPLINEASLSRAIHRPAAPTLHPVDYPALFVHDVVLATANRLGINQSAILGPSRKAPVARARQICWTVAYLATERRLSLPMIGRFTNRDHTTVLAGLWRIAALAVHSPRIVAQIEEIIGDLRRSGWELQFGLPLDRLRSDHVLPASRKWQAAVTVALDDVPRSTREIADRIDNAYSLYINDVYRELRCLERDGAALSRVVMNKPGHPRREWRRSE